MMLRILLCSMCALTIHAVNRPPLIYIQPSSRDIYYKPGESVILPCIARGIPKPQYLWRRNGEAYNPSGQDDRVVQLPNQSTIVFNSPEDKDEGIFQCFADNGYGVSASIKINLREAKLKKFAYEDKKTHRVDAGRDLTLPCTPPQSSPPADVYWVYKEPDGRWQAINFDKRVSMDIEGRLRFTNVKTSDARGGKAYSCMAINYFMRDNAIGPEHVVQVEGTTEQKRPAHELWTSPSDQFFVKGKLMKLKCIFAGNPTPDVYWQKIDGVFPDRASFKSFGQELHIKDIHISDAGQYECMGLNTESTQRATKAFDVRIESAPYWVDEPISVEASINERATFICRASADPEPSYSWFINGIPLEDRQNEQGVRDPRIYENNRFFKPNENNITLTNLTLEDHMNIQCNASNKHGYVFSDVYLNVLGERVIQDWAELKPGRTDLLMVQDETTSPGYCLIQLLQSDAPLPATYSASNKYLRDDKGRILFKNTIMNAANEDGIHQTGPAISGVGPRGEKTFDIVPAYYCESWPKEARGWLDRQCVGNWPSDDIKRLAVSKGCFLVPVGSKCNNLDQVEWRISTSIAERLMMFDLNITQIRCYVMMKFISKTFLTINGQSTLTSFMCKCIVFHCIENTHAYCWRENNLFPCVMNCLCTLYDQVQRLNCPHYIIPTNNLMAQRISADQQRYLMNVLSSLINSNTDMLFAVKIDDLGTRLQMTLTGVLPRFINVPSRPDPENEIVADLLSNQGRINFYCFDAILLPHAHVGLIETASKLFGGIQRLQTHYCTCSDMAVEAYTHFIPLLCTFVGSLLASYSVYTNHTVSPEAIWWFSSGFDFDVSYSRLKLASAFYCAGDINNAELIVRELDHKCTDYVRSMCACYRFAPEGYLQVYIDRNNEMHLSMAFCVKFLRCESPIIPQELRQELFRSTELEIENRGLYDKKWMDFAVVDSRPYLYFLQYKVYKHLGRRQQYRQALGKLLRTTLNEPNLSHRETAWNLLGQCMEQETMPVNARWCYQKSLALRPHNNAANVHMARLPRL